MMENSLRELNVEFDNQIALLLHLGWEQLVIRVKSDITCHTSWHSVALYDVLGLGRDLLRRSDGNRRRVEQGD